MSKSQQKLLFIYNADSGFINSLIDHGKKYISPSSYDCQLCMLSYGPFGMRKEWKTFTEELPYDVAFLHKDELNAQYPYIKTSPPAVVYLGKANSHSVLLDSGDFASISGLSDLKASVMKAFPR